MVTTSRPMTILIRITGCRSGMTENNAINILKNFNYCLALKTSCSVKNVEDRVKNYVNMLMTERKYKNSLKSGFQGSVFKITLIRMDKLQDGSTMIKVNISRAFF